MYWPVLDSKNMGAHKFLVLLFLFVIAPILLSRTQTSLRRILNGPPYSCIFIFYLLLLWWTMDYSREVCWPVYSFLSSLLSHIWMGLQFPYSLFYNSPSISEREERMNRYRNMSHNYVNIKYMIAWLTIHSFIFVSFTLSARQEIISLIHINCVTIFLSFIYYISLIISICEDVTIRSYFFFPFSL